MHAPRDAGWGVREKLNFWMHPLRNYEIDDDTVKTVGAARAGVRRRRRDVVDAAGEGGGGGRGAGGLGGRVDGAWR